MCGLIVAGHPAIVEQGIVALAHRGPDHQDVSEHDGWHLGHTRLSILDLSAAANQPMRRGRTTVVYNGELWNYEQLAAELQAGTRPLSTGDTEVLCHLLDQKGEAILPDLAGQFAVAWVTDGTLRVARDRHGEIPVHYGYHPKYRTVVVASERKALLDVGVAPQTVRWVPPGTVMSWASPIQQPVVREWHTHDLRPLPDDEETAVERVDGLLAAATRKRMVTSDVPVAVLLSGGIDSSAVAFHARNHYPNLVGYTAVFDTKSKDLRCAREVAEHLGMELREVPVPAPSAADLAAVVRAIELPHKAQVEIGWACLHLADRLRSDGMKVVLSGEGADELWGSYGRAALTIRDLGWHRARGKFVVDQHRKNFARVNKVFMARSVEGRLPFADRFLVEYALGLRQDAVTGHLPDRKATQDKMVLRDGYWHRLPHSVIQRQKAAFQTEAKIPEACLQVVNNPQKFYRSEFVKAFGSKAA